MVWPATMQVTNLGVVGRGRSRITPTPVADLAAQNGASSGSKTGTLEEAPKRRTLEDLMAGDSNTAAGFDSAMPAKHPSTEIAQVRLGFACAVSKMKRLPEPDAATDYVRR
jgi:hypothetical protein